jgi:hypothetical protein
MTYELVQQEKLSEGKELAPDDLAKLSEVKAKLEVIGD